MNIKKGSEIELTIDSAAFEGKGIGKIDGLVVFVPNTAPGDQIKAHITKKKSSFCEGELVEVLDPGPNRIEPKCQHAANCGGCHWQHVSYDAQLDFKQDQVRDHMHRIGGLTHLDVNDTLGCENPLYYRNKMEYSFSHKRWLSQEEIERDEYIDDEGFSAGLHPTGQMNKVIDINECHLQEPVSYQLLDFVRSWCIENDMPPYNRAEQKGFMRKLIVRNSFHTDDLMVNLITYKDDQDVMTELSDALLDSFPEVTTIVNNINDRRNSSAVGRYENVIHGPGQITDSIGPYKFQIDANAFFQTNTQQAERLYEVARDFADIEPDDTVYDLYCGVGTLSLFLSDKCKKLVGIEIEKSTIRNAKKNASNNDVNNVTFLQGDMKEVFNNEITNKYGQPDCLITDPPRAGMHSHVVEQLKKIKVPKLVYVSCNSSTMARDLEKLNEVYDIFEIQPVDMFPQTYHIETVAKLRLKDS